MRDIVASRPISRLSRPPVHRSPRIAPPPSRWPPPLRRFADTPIRRYADTPLRRIAASPHRRIAASPTRRYADAPAGPFSRRAARRSAPAPSAFAAARPILRNTPLSRLCSTDRRLTPP